MRYDPDTKPRQDATAGWFRELHGTRARYRKGCTCDPCRRAEREYRAAYRLRRKAAATADTEPAA